MSDLIFDHIGIVVADIERGRRSLQDLLGSVSWTERFDDENLGVSVVFARDASMVVYEIIAPFGESSPVSNIVSSRREALNQIAYRTASTAQSLAELRRKGALPIGPARPAKAFGGANVQFLMTPLGFIVELIEGLDDVHVFR